MCEYGKTVMPTHIVKSLQVQNRSNNATNYDCCTHGHFGDMEV